MSMRCREQELCRSDPLSSSTMQKSGAAVVANIRISASLLETWTPCDVFFGLCILLCYQLKEKPCDTLNGRPDMGKAEGEAEQKAVGEAAKEALHWIKWAIASYSKKLGRCQLKGYKYEIFERVVKPDFCQPGHVIGVDHSEKAVVLGISGTKDFKDLETDLLCVEGSPHGERAAHAGMRLSAEWLINKTFDTLRELLSTNEGYRLVVTGHSLGAGVAALVTLLIRDTGANAECLTVLGVKADKVISWGYGCPPCVDENWAAADAPFNHNVILQDDAVPRLSLTSINTLLAQIRNTNWEELDDGLKTKVLKRLEKCLQIAVDKTELKLKLGKGELLTKKGLESGKKYIGKIVTKMKDGDYGSYSQRAIARPVRQAERVKAFLTKRGLTQKLNQKVNIFRADIARERELLKDVSLVKLIVPGVLYHVNRHRSENNVLSYSMNRRNDDLPIVLRLSAGTDHHYERYQQVLKEVVN